MSKSQETADERFEMQIDCPDYVGGRTTLRAQANLNGLDRMEVESIAELNVDDIRQLVSYGKGGIDSDCEPCAPPATVQRLAELGGTSLSTPEVPRRRPTSGRQVLLIRGADGTANMILALVPKTGFFLGRISSQTSFHLSIRAAI